MLRRNVLGVIVAVLAYAAGGAGIHASGGHGRTLVVTMTNDPNANQIRVYDAESHVLLQTLSTHGKGGVGGNARGVKQHDGRLVAVVNNGSNSVALFTRDGDVLKFDNVVPTTSAPVSVDFGNDHLYVAGATTVDSFVLHQNSVQGLDGTTALELAGGGAPATGSTSQVGVIGERQLLVTLKTDPDPGTIDIIDLDRGRVSGSAATAVSAPDGSLAPFGFATYPDGTALITLAHSNQDGLFRNGSFTSIVAAGQAASCWMTRPAKCLRRQYGRRSISRVIGTGNNVFVDGLVARRFRRERRPTSMQNSGFWAIDHGAGRRTCRCSRNRWRARATGTTITVGVPNANGVAILSPRDDDRN